MLGHPLFHFMKDIKNWTSSLYSAGGVSETIEATRIDNQKNTLKNKHLRE